MSSFQTLQSRVKTRLIDVTAATLAEVPTLIQEAQDFLQAMHNFQAMKSEVTYNTVPAPTTYAPTAALTQHILGVKPANWKEPYGNPYYQLQIGAVREIDWAPAGSRTYTYRAYDPLDPNSKGPPRLILMSDPVTDYASPPDPTDATTNIEVYPYSDSQSDWTSSPVGEYRVHIPFWGYVATLVNNSDVNWFTENATQFLVDFATYRGFMLEWDEQRAGVWKNEAIGAYNGVDFRTLGGWARRAINRDVSSAFAPGRVLVPRRDVYAPRDQWRQ